MNKLAFPLTFGLSAAGIGTYVPGLGALTGANSAPGDLFLVIDISDTSASPLGTPKNMTRTELNAAIIKDTLQDNLVMASGKGIDFSASANGSGTTASEVFNDYERGTFTPALQFGGAAVSLTSALAQGYYEKIGNRVFFDIIFVLTAKGSSVGAATFTGLPFTSSADNIQRAAQSSYYELLATAINPAHRIAASATVVQLGTAGGTLWVALADTDFNNNSTIMVNGSYFV